MIPYADLPHINAVLNATSGLLLLLGYIFIRRNKRGVHHACMTAAVALSGLFLVSYLLYHAHAGSVRFQGHGLIRTFYFLILISHSTLAAVVFPMIIVTFARAAMRRIDSHRRLARWTFPIWLYVSVTGVLVYLMLYRL
jgi:uncharacterized membrane protein YozB (DUF420 family)